MKLVFVSSTFRDMQFERDALNSHVVPRLNSFLERYAESVYFDDLRWGVNTTELENEESSKKVLKVCLDQIDDCKPYMIVFVGERYGWIPPAELICNAAEIKGMDSSEIKENTSVTALEIEYGALLDPDYEGRVLFYFRNPFDMSKMSEEERKNYISESPLHEQKVNDLKQQILKTYPNHVRYYDVTYDEGTRRLLGLEPLMEQIYDDLCRIFDLDLTHINSLPPEERAISSSESHFAKLTENSYFREESEITEFDFDAFKYENEKRFENTPAFELVVGRPGSGAKTLVAQKYENALDTGYNAVCFSYGMDEFTNSTEKMIAAFSYALEDFMDMEHEGDSSVKRLGFLCDKYTRCPELPYLYFFAINLPASAILEFRRLAALYPNLFGVGFCVHLRSASPESAKNIPLPFFLKNRILEVPPLRDDEIEGIIEAIVKANRKELAPVVINEIKKHSAASLPLYLSLLVSRLMILDSEDFEKIRALGDGMDNINAYMISLIRSSGDNVTEIAGELLEELCERINPIMIPQLIAHLAIPNHFNEPGIQEFFDYRGWNYSTLDYTLFKSTFPSLLYQSTSGFLQYANADVKEAALMLCRKWEINSACEDMLSFLDTKTTSVATKAKMLIYRHLGNADAFANIAIECLDGAREKNDRHLAQNCFDVFSDVMNTEIEENTDFAFEVSKLIFDKIALGEVKYPYDMISYLYQCIQADYDAENLNKSFAFLKRLEGYFEKRTKEVESEELTIAFYLLYSLHIMPFSFRLGGDTTINTLNKSNTYQRTLWRDIPKRLLELHALGTLSFSGAMERTTASLLYVYKDLPFADDVLQNPAFGALCSLCAELEKEALADNPEHYRDILSGNFKGIKETNRALHAIFFPFMGFCLDKTGSKEKARICYEAFYSIHKGLFEKDPPSVFYLGMYISAIRNYLSYLFAIGDENAKARFTELFAWCESEMLTTDFGYNYELMKLHMMGAQKECFEDEYDPFCNIFGSILIRAAATPLYPQTVDDIMDYYKYFGPYLSSSEENNEQAKYFALLMTQISKGIASTGAATGEMLLEILCDFAIGYCLSSSKSISDFIQMTVMSVVEGLPEIFTEEKELYFNLAYHIATEILTDMQGE